MFCCMRVLACFLKLLHAPMHFLSLQPPPPTPTLLYAVKARALTPEQYIIAEDLMDKVCFYCWCFGQRCHARAFETRHCMGLFHQKGPSAQNTNCRKEANCTQTNGNSFVTCGQLKRHKNKNPDSVCTMYTHSWPCSEHQRDSEGSQWRNRSFRKDYSVRATMSLFKCPWMALFPCFFLLYIECCFSAVSSARPGAYTAAVRVRRKPLPQKGIHKCICVAGVHAWGPTLEWPRVLSQIL